MGRYDTFKVTKKGQEKMDQLRKAYAELEELLGDQEVMLAQREKAIAITNLESSCMFAIKAVALLNKE